MAAKRDRMHEYSVALRIHGKKLDPSIVTAEMGLEPARTVEIGQRRSGAQRADSASWTYEGGERGNGKMWPTLEAGLSFLLDRLEPMRPVIARYQTVHEVVWWCGHFQSAFDGGPSVSPKLLQRLADFGVELFIDNYFSEVSSDEAKSPKKTSQRPSTRSKRQAR